MAPISQIRQSPTEASVCHLLVSSNHAAAPVKPLMLPGTIQISIQSSSPSKSESVNRSVMFDSS